MRRRIAAFVIGLIILGGAFWSCREIKRVPEAVTLKVVGEDWTPMQGLERLVPLFKQETGVNVIISKYDAQTLRKKSIADFQSGGSQYDVVMGWGMDIGLVAQNHYVLNLDEQLSKAGARDPKMPMDNFPPAFVESFCKYKGTLYALPCSAQGMLLWYRKDLFENEGERNAFKARYGYAMPVPTPERSMTWAQYRDLAEFFTRPKGQRAAGRFLEDDLYGTVLQGKNFIALWYEFSNYLYGFHGSAVGPDGRQVTINSSEALSALDFYLGLRKFAPPGTANYTWDEALSAFQNGQVALSIMWTDSINLVEDRKASKVAGLIGYSANPTLTAAGEPQSVSAGWGFYVNAKSRHPKEAVAFIQWCNRPDIQAKWAAVGLIPTTRSTYQSPPYSTMPGAVAQLAALEHSFIWSKEPYSGRLVVVGQEVLARAVAGELSSREALGELEGQYRAIVAGKPVSPATSP
jgi:multiple sugar transport system substrate-binding protein